LSKEELGTRSVRRNPLIADLLHRIAFIEKAGTGIRRMREEARRHKCPEPKFTVNGFLTATFWPTGELVHKITPEVTPQATPQVTGEVAGELGPYARKILEFCNQQQPMRIISEAIGIRKWDNVKPHLSALIKAGFLEMTIPDKPRSPKQRYRTTDLGRKVLEQWNNNEISYLRLLMDEIFGPSCFVSELIWKSRQHLDSRSKNGISLDHEYLLVYEKRKGAMSFRGKECNRTKYKNPDGDARGPWMSRSILGLATAAQRPNLHFDCQPFKCSYPNKQLNLRIHS
jgi:DNA-binding PadR family transcriptional regulator